MDFNLNFGALSVEKNFSPLDPERLYDVFILGGGPAGLTAAVYCIRKGLATAIAVRETGGQVTWTAGIENYMGYRHIGGIELVQKFREQVLQFGIDFGEGVIVRSLEDGSPKTVTLEDGRRFSARTIIVATGKDMRRLNIPGETELTGRGVAFCSICDAPLFAGKRVIVVGGGNSAMEAVIDLAPIAEHVTVVQFLDELTADRVLAEKARSYKNVEFLFGHELTAITGAAAVESAVARDRKSGLARTLPVQGVFIQIGLVPNSASVRGVLELNENGEIVVDCSCRTSRAGIFAAGDVTSVPFKQIIIAGGEGAKAALSAYEYLIRG